MRLDGSVALIPVNVAKVAARDGETIWSMTSIVPETEIVTVTKVVYQWLVVPVVVMTVPLVVGVAAWCWCPFSVIDSPISTANTIATTRARVTITLFFALL